MGLAATTKSTDATTDHFLKISLVRGHYSSCSVFSVLSRSPGVSLLPTGITWALSQSLTPSCSIREQSNWRKSQPNAGLSRDMSTGWWSLLLTITTTSLRLKDWQAEWSTLIGPDCRDPVLSLVEPYYPGSKVYAITTHLKALKMPHWKLISVFHTRKGSITGTPMP